MCVRLSDFFIRQAFELAGMRQNGHRNAGQDCGAIGSENSVDDTADGAEGYFGCLRIDGEVPTALRSVRHGSLRSLSVLLSTVRLVLVRLAAATQI